VHFNTSSFAPLPTGLDECLAKHLGMERISRIRQLSFKSTGETEWLLISGFFLIAGEDPWSSANRVFPNHFSHSAWFVAKPKDMRNWKDARVYMVRTRTLLTYTPREEDIFKMPDFEMRSYLVALGPLPYTYSGEPLVSTNCLGLAEAFVSRGKSYDEFIAKARAVYNKYVAFTDNAMPSYVDFDGTKPEEGWRLPVSECYASDLLGYISDVWQNDCIMFYRNIDEINVLTIYIQEGRFCVNVYPEDRGFPAEPTVIHKSDLSEFWTWGRAATIQENTVPL